LACVGVSAKAGAEIASIAAKAAVIVFLDIVNSCPDWLHLTIQRALLCLGSALPVLVVLIELACRQVPVCREGFCAFG
jgi:hypothetical protein